MLQSTLSEEQPTSNTHCWHFILHSLFSQNLETVIKERDNLTSKLEKLISDHATLKDNLQSVVKSKDEKLAEQAAQVIIIKFSKNYVTPSGRYTTELKSLFSGLFFWTEMPSSSGHSILHEHPARVARPASWKQASAKGHVNVRTTEGQSER